MAVVYELIPPPASNSDLPIMFYGLLALPYVLMGIVTGLLGGLFLGAVFGVWLTSQKQAEKAERVAMYIGCLIGISYPLFYLLGEVTWRMNNLSLFEVFLTLILLIFGAIIGGLAGKLGIKNFQKAQLR